MKKDIKVYLADIKESIIKIEDYIRGLSQADFFDSTEKQDAVMRRLGIIGEAVKHIPDEFRNQHSTIAWDDIAGMRDKLIHEYSGIKLAMVWKTVDRDIPDLKRKLGQLFKEIEK